MRREIMTLSAKRAGMFAKRTAPAQPTKPKANGLKAAVKELLTDYDFKQGFPKGAELQQVKRKVEEKLGIDIAAGALNNAIKAVNKELYQERKKARDG